MNDDQSLTEHLDEQHRLEVLDRPVLKNICHSGFYLRVVQTQTILFLKSMSEIGGSDIDFEDKTAWVWTTLNIEIELLSVFTMFIYGNDWLRGDVSWCDWNIFSLPIVESNNIRKP